MRKLAVKVLCFIMVALIISRLFSNSKEAKAQMLGFMLLLMVAILVGSGMLDKLLERAKEQGLLDNNNKQLN